MQLLILPLAAIILILALTPITSLLITQRRGSRDGTFWKSVLCSALFIGLVIGVIFASRYFQLQIESLVYYVMGLALIGCLLALGFWMVYMILSVFGLQKHLISLPVRVGFVLLRLGTTTYGIYNFQRPLDIIKLEFTHPGVTQQTQFVYFADTQYGSTSKTHFTRVIETINDLNPAFVAFGGDLIDTDYYALSDFEALNTLQVPLYFVTGNHEYYHDQPRITQYMNQYSQVRILIDERLDLGNDIEVIGVDYKNSFDREQYDRTITTLQGDDDKFSLFLYHEPKWVEETARLGGYDLQMYGHTHRGQLYPGPWIIQAIYGAYGYGLTLIEGLDTRVYTTSGAGLFGPNIRLGTRNEIVSVTVSPE